MRYNKKSHTLIAVSGLLLSAWSWGKVDIESEPAPPVPGTSSTATELVIVDEPRALRSGYNLPVTEIPPPLALLNRLKNGCPLEVRGLVVGETRESTFAMVALIQETRLLRVGESVDIAGIIFTAHEIGPETLILQQGDVAIRCALSKLTR